MATTVRDRTTGKTTTKSTSTRKRSETPSEKRAARNVTKSNTGRGKQALRDLTPPPSRTKPQPPSVTNRGRRIVLVSQDAEVIRPHFQVRKELLDAVQPLMDEDWVTISTVVHVGFRKFAGNRDTDGPAGRTRQLPNQAVSQIRKYMQAGDSQRLNAYILVLSEAQYSLAAIAAVMGVTAQAVSDRLKRIKNSKSPVVNVPAAPETRLRADLRRLMEMDVPVKDRKDTSFRLDPEVYYAAQERANEMGVRITYVVELVLEWYLDGKLKMPKRGHGG